MEKRITISLVLTGIIATILTVLLVTLTFYKNYAILLQNENILVLQANDFSYWMLLKSNIYVIVAIIVV